MGYYPVFNGILEQTVLQKVGAMAEMVKGVLSLVQSLVHDKLQIHKISEAKATHKLQNYITNYINTSVSRLSINIVWIYTCSS